MNKTFLVRMPIAGVMTFEVEAESGEDAINKAQLTDVRIDLVEGETDNSPEMEEWDLYKKTVSGNVNYTPLWEAEYEEL